MGKVCSLSGEELAVIKKLDGTKLPKEVDFEYFQHCNELKPLYSVAKAVGLVPSNVKKWADAAPGRYEMMGLFAFGLQPNKKQHFVNVRTFTDWALKNPNTRRQMIRHFHSDVARVKKGQERTEILDNGKCYIFEELCVRGIIPKPFSSKKGRETLIEMARGHNNPKEAIGLYQDHEFSEWLVEPSRFFKFLVNAYGLVPVD